MIVSVCACVAMYLFIFVLYTEFLLNIFQAISKARKKENMP